MQKLPPAQLRIYAADIQETLDFSVNGNARRQSFAYSERLKCRKLAQCKNAAIKQRLTPARSSYLYVVNTHYYLLIDDLYII